MFDARRAIRLFPAQAAPPAQTLAEPGTYLADCCIGIGDVVLGGCHQPGHGLGTGNGTPIPGDPGRGQVDELFAVYEIGRAEPSSRADIVDGYQTTVNYRFTTVD